LIATVAASALALGAWKLSDRVTVKPVAPTAVVVEGVKNAKAPPTSVRARPPVTPARQASKTPAPAPDPQAACADRNFFARSVCVSLQCTEPQFAQHPVCVQLRREEDLRQQAQMNR